MARRAPFPLSSIPAYIEQSMKLFVCLLHLSIKTSSRWRVQDVNLWSLCDRFRVSGIVSFSPDLLRRAQLTVWRYSYRIWRVEVLDPPGNRVSGPRPAAVGITELGGVAGAAEGQVWRQRGRAAKRST